MTKLEFNTIREARQNGVKCKISHYRFPRTERAIRRGDDWIVPFAKEPLLANVDLLPEDYYARGGQTVVEISYQDKHAEGVAYCNIVDSYNRKTGVQLALQRAQEAWNSFEQPKAEGPEL